MRCFSTQYPNLFFVRFTSVIPPWSFWILLRSSELFHQTCFLEGAFHLRYFGLSNFVILPLYLFQIYHSLPFLIYLFGCWHFLQRNEVWVQFGLVRRVLQDIGLILYIHYIPISNYHHNFSSLYCYVFQSNMFTHILSLCISIIYQTSLLDDYIRLVY